MKNLFRLMRTKRLERTCALKALLWSGLVLVALFNAPCVRADAARFNALKAFSFAKGGDLAGSLIADADGSFYGITSGGGDYGGTFFRLSANGPMTVLHHFTGGDDGAGPYVLIPGKGGRFYGVTASGRKVFSVTRTGELGIIHAFAPDGSEGGGSISLTLGSDGSLYGTTFYGGEANRGTLFRLAMDGELTRLYSFSQQDLAANPNSLVEGRDGTLYGTAVNGLNGTGGGVFTITPDGRFTLLHHFVNRFVDGKTQWAGASPQSRLLAAPDGGFYGTTSSGGAHGEGTVFKVTPQGEVAYLYEFSDPRNVGDSPHGNLVQDAAGNLYGITRGGRWYGKVFRLSPAGEYTVLHEFADGEAGVSPVGGVSLDRRGALYGVAGGGLSNERGLIYRVRPNPVVTLTVQVAQTAVGGGTPGEFVVSIPQALSHDLRVRYKLKGSAVNGRDYTFLPGVAKIKAGQTSRRIRVKAQGNLGGKASRTLKLTLIEDENCAIAGPAQGVVKITGR